MGLKKIIRRKKKKARADYHSAEAIGLIADRSGGKTTSAVNIFWTLAAWGYDVIYVDGDIEIGGKFTDILLESSYFDFATYREDGKTRSLVEGNPDEIDYTLGSILATKDEKVRKNMVDKAIHTFILPDEQRFNAYVKERLKTGQPPQNVVEWLQGIYASHEAAAGDLEGLANSLPPERDTYRDKMFATANEFREQLDLIARYLSNEIFDPSYSKNPKKPKLGHTGILFSKNEDMELANDSLGKQKDENVFGRVVDYLSEVKGYDFIIVDTPIGKRDMVSTNLILGLDSWLAPLMLDGGSSVLRMQGLRDHIDSIRRQYNLDLMKNLGVFFTRWIDFYDVWDADIKMEYDKKIIEEDTEDYPLLEEKIRENKLIVKNTARGIPAILSLLQWEYVMDFAIDILKKTNYTINDAQLSYTTYTLFHELDSSRKEMHYVYEMVKFEKFCDAIKGALDYADLSKQLLKSVKKAGHAVRFGGKIVNRLGGQND
jgi:cellulose biosynthesis protein BcsQ